MKNYIVVPMNGIVVICALVGGYVILRRLNEFVHFDNIIFGKDDK
jgi:hypothetical protein